MLERSIVEGSRGCQTSVSESRIRAKPELWCLVLCAWTSSCPRIRCGVSIERRTKFKDQDHFAMNIRSILLPTDFSECGNFALSYAASLARTFKASIICLNVIEPIVPTVGYSGMTEPLPIADIAEQLEDSAERELPKLAECDECSGLNVEELVVHGEAASEIVRVAKERAVDLIVIASHGTNGFRTNSLWLNCRSRCSTCTVSCTGRQASANRRRRTVVNRESSSLFCQPP